MGYVSSFSMRVGPRRRRAHRRAGAPRRRFMVALGLHCDAPRSPRSTRADGAALAGAGLLVAAELSTLYEVRVVTAVPEGGSFPGGRHHGYALAIIAMAAAAVLRRSRPAALAVLVLALAALAIALLIDLPDVHETGLLGRAYEAARAEPRAGFYLELAGGCVALLGAALILVVRARLAEPHQSRRRRPLSG